MGLKKPRVSAGSGSLWQTEHFKGPRRGKRSRGWSSGSAARQRPACRWLPGRDRNRLGDPRSPICTMGSIGQPTPLRSCGVRRWSERKGTQQYREHVTRARNPSMIRAPGGSVLHSHAQSSTHWPRNLKGTPSLTWVSGRTLKCVQLTPLSNIPQTPL